MDENKQPQDITKKANETSTDLSKLTKEELTESGLAVLAGAYMIKRNVK